VKVNRTMIARRVITEARAIMDYYPYSRIRIQVKREVMLLEGGS